MWWHPEGFPELWDFLWASANCNLWTRPLRLSPSHRPSPRRFFFFPPRRIIWMCSFSANKLLQLWWMPRCAEEWEEREQCGKSEMIYTLQSAPLVWRCKVQQLPLQAAHCHLSFYVKTWALMHIPTSSSPLHLAFYNPLLIIRSMWTAV